LARQQLRRHIIRQQVLHRMRSARLRWCSAAVHEVNTTRVNKSRARLAMRQRLAAARRATQRNRKASSQRSRKASSQRALSAGWCVP
jgi:hypothetical protein